MSGWVVVQAQPQRQQLAIESLQSNEGCEVYAPRFAVCEFKDGRRVRQERFLFGTYLFARLESFWHFMQSARGVSRVLTCGDGPSRVADQVIQRLRAREDKHGFIHLPVTPEFLLGQAVRVERGCFAGHRAIYQGSQSLEREYVLLSIMGRMTKVSVSAGSLAAA